MAVIRRQPLPLPVPEHKWVLCRRGLNYAGTNQDNRITTSDNKADLEAIAQTNNYNYRRTHLHKKVDGEPLWIVKENTLPYKRA